jgi:Fe-S cluster assembly scaffold protein SufB
MIHFKNPSGKKQIIVSEKNIQKKIFLEDLELGNREFFLEVFVEGENNNIEIIGRAESRQADNKKWKVSIVLKGKNQIGKLDLRGISDEKGILEFDGGATIDKESSGGSVNVTEKIVLFSPNAKAKNIPVLRVETEDVSSAHHSASIAPFSPEIFFFLENRGIDPKEGKKLLKEGFLKI